MTTKMGLKPTTTDWPEMVALWLGSTYQQILSVA